MNKYQRRFFSYVVLGAMGWQYLFPVVELAVLTLVAPKVVEANHACGMSCDEFTAEGACTHGCWAGGDPNPDYRGGQEYRHEESVPAAPGTDAGSDEGARQAREAEAARQAQQQQAAPPPQPTAPPPPPTSPPIPTPVPAPQAPSGCFGPWDCGGNQYCAGAGSYPDHPGVCVTPSGGGAVNQDRTNEQIQRDFVAAGGNADDFKGALGAEPEQKEEGKGKKEEGKAEEKEGQKGGRQISDIYCNYCGGFWADPKGPGCRDQATARCPDESGLKPAAVGGQCFNANGSPCGKNGYGTVDIDDNGDGETDRTEVLTSTAGGGGKCSDGREPTAGRCFDPLPQKPEAKVEAPAAALGSSVLEAEEIKFLKEGRGGTEGKDGQEVITKIEPKLMPPTVIPLPTQRLKDDTAFPTAVPTAGRKLEPCRPGIGRNPDGSCADPESNIKIETETIRVGGGKFGQDVTVTAKTFCSGDSVVTQTRRSDGVESLNSTSCDWGCSAGACRGPTPEEAQVYRYSLLQNAIDREQIACAGCSNEVIYNRAVNNLQPEEISPAQVEIFNQAGQSDTVKQAISDKKYEELINQAFLTNAAASETGAAAPLTEEQKAGLRQQADKYAEEVVNTGSLSATGHNTLNADNQVWDKISNASAEEAERLVDQQGWLGGVIANNLFCAVNNNYRAAGNCGLQASIPPLSDEGVEQGQEFWSFLVAGKSEQTLWDQGMIFGDPRSAGYQAREYDDKVAPACGVQTWQRSLTDEETACLTGQSVAAKARIAEVDEQNAQMAALNIGSVALGFAGGAAAGGIKAVDIASKIGKVVIGSGAVSDVVIAVGMAEAMTAGDRTAAAAVSAMSQAQGISATEQEVWSGQAEDLTTQADESYKQNVMYGVLFAAVGNVAGEVGMPVVGKAASEALGETPVGRLLFGNSRAAAEAAAEVADAMNVTLLTPEGTRLTMKPETVGVGEIGRGGGNIEFEVPGVGVRRVPAEQIENVLINAPQGTVVRRVDDGRIFMADSTGKFHEFAAEGKLPTGVEAVVGRAVTAEDVLGARNTLAEVNADRLSGEPMVAVGGESGRLLPAAGEVAETVNNWPVRPQEGVFDQMVQAPAEVGGRIGNAVDDAVDDVRVFTNCKIAMSPISQVYAAGKGGCFTIGPGQNDVPELGEGVSVKPDADGQTVEIHSPGADPTVIHQGDTAILPTGEEIHVVAVKSDGTAVVKPLSGEIGPSVSATQAEKLSETIIKPLENNPELLSTVGPFVETTKDMLKRKPDVIVLPGDSAVRYEEAIRSIAKTNGIDEVPPIIAFPTDNQGVGIETEINGQIEKVGFLLPGPNALAYKDLSGFSGVSGRAGIDGVFNTADRVVESRLRTTPSDERLLVIQGILKSAREDYNRRPIGFLSESSKSWEPTIELRLALLELFYPEKMAALANARSVAFFDDVALTGHKLCCYEDLFDKNIDRSIERYVVIAENKARIPEGTNVGTTQDVANYHFLREYIEDDGSTFIRYVKLHDEAFDYESLFAGAASPEERNRLREAFFATANEFTDGKPVLPFQHHVQSYAQFLQEKAKPPAGIAWVSNAIEGAAEKVSAFADSVTKTVGGATAGIRNAAEETAKAVSGRKPENFVEYLTGVQYDDPSLSQRMVDDHFAIKQKYGLPDRGQRFEGDLAEYIRKLEGIAKENGIPVRDKSEFAGFFEDYEYAGAVYDNKGKQIFIDLSADPVKRAGVLEHELIHALQDQRYPSMPFEVQEYEAYIGANTSIGSDFLSDPENVDRIFAQIGLSSKHAYKSEGLIVPWERNKNGLVDSIVDTVGGATAGIRNAADDAVDNVRVFTSCGIAMSPISQVYAAGKGGCFTIGPGQNDVPELGEGVSVKPDADGQAVVVHSPGADPVVIHQGDTAILPTGEEIHVVAVKSDGSAVIQPTSTMAEVNIPVGKTESITSPGTLLSNRLLYVGSGDDLSPLQFAPQATELVYLDTEQFGPERINLIQRLRNLETSGRVFGLEISGDIAGDQRVDIHFNFEGSDKHIISIRADANNIERVANLAPEIQEGYGILYEKGGPAVLPVKGRDFTLSLQAQDYLISRLADENRIIYFPTSDMMIAANRGLPGLLDRFFKGASIDMSRFLRDLGTNIETNRLQVVMTTQFYFSGAIDSHLTDSGFAVAQRVGVTQNWVQAPVVEISGRNTGRARAGMGIFNQPFGIVAPGFREGEPFGPGGWFDFNWKGFRDENGKWQFPVGRESTDNKLNFAPSGEKEISAAGWGKSQDQKILSEESDVQKQSGNQHQSIGNADLDIDIVNIDSGSFGQVHKVLSLNANNKDIIASDKLKVNNFNLADLERREVEISTEATPIQPAARLMNKSEKTEFQIWLAGIWNKFISNRGPLSNKLEMLTAGGEVSAAGGGGANRPGGFAGAVDHRRQSHQDDSQSQDRHSQIDDSKFAHDVFFDNHMANNQNVIVAVTPNSSIREEVLSITAGRITDPSPTRPTPTQISTAVWNWAGVNNGRLGTNTNNSSAIEGDVNTVSDWVSVMAPRAYAAEKSSARIVPLSMYRALAGQVLLKKAVLELPENERSAEKLGEAALAAAMVNSIPRVGTLSLNEAGYTTVSGTGGTAAGAVGKGIYKVTAEAVPGIDLVIPAKVNVGVNGDGAVMIGVNEGKGRVKVVGELKWWERPMMRLGEWIETRLIQPVGARAFEGSDPATLEGFDPSAAGRVPLTIQLFIDENKNGKMDEGEDPAKLAGVKVNLVAETKTVSYKLTEGWNLVAFPVAPESVKTAAELVQDVALDGGYVTTVATWEGDKWMEFSQRGAQKFGQDFDLAPGRAYFLNSQKDSGWALAGTPLAEEKQVLQLRKGWNGVGIPRQGTTAVQVMDDIQITDNREQRTVGGETADQVGRWDFGLWDVVVKRRYSPERHEIYGRDFPIKETEGYFIHANEEVRFR